MVLRVRDEVADENLTRCYESPEGAPQTGGPLIRTLQLLLQRPPLAMFDPSLIHRNDEIFNPEPNGLGFFLRCIPLVDMKQKTHQIPSFRA